MFCDTVSILKNTAHENTFLINSLHARTYILYGFEHLTARKQCFDCIWKKLTFEKSDFKHMVACYLYYDRVPKLKKKS